MRAMLMASVAMTACTAGMVTQQNGAQWTPADDGSPLTSAVVTFSNASASYQVWTTTNSEMTSFSFDPNAASMSNGNYQTNNNTIVSPGTYTATLAANHVWKANVTVNDGQACPFTDYYTGASTDCEVFQFQLLNCGVAAQPPSQSGDLTVVQLAQECGVPRCPFNVTDVACSFDTNPAIT